jgi:hypothetical protein
LQVLLGFALSALYGFVYKPAIAALHRKAWGPDVELSNNLVGSIATGFPFIKAVDDNSPWTIYAQPARNSTQLLLYGVTNLETQNKIVSLVRDWQSTNRSMAEISVRFYNRARGRSQYGELLPKEPLCIVLVQVAQEGQ